MNKYIKPAIITIIGVVLSVSAFMPAVDAPFFNDDNVYIIGNKNFDSPINEVWKFFFKRTNNYEYLPIRDIVYRVEYEMFGENPLGYRIVNYLLYILCCHLVYRASKLIVQLFKQKNLISGETLVGWMPAIITIMFAAHPAHVESVVWISSMKDLLSGVFMFLALFYFIKGIIGEALIKKYLYSSWVLFLAALLSKSTVIPLVFMIFVIASVRFGISRQNFKQVFKTTQPFLIIGVVFLFVYMHFGSDSKILAAPFLFGTLESVVNNFHIPILILGYLVRIALIPINLRLIYDVIDFGAPFIIAIVFGAVCIIVSIFALRYLNRRLTLIAFGIIWFTVFTLPYLQIIPFNSWSFASERYLFLSIYGLVLMIAAVIISLNKKTGMIITISIVIFYLSSTFSYSSIWKTQDTLVENNARYNPNNTSSQMMYVELVLIPQKRYGEALEIAAKSGKTEIDKERFVRYIKVFQAYDYEQWDEIEKHCEWLEGMTGMNSSNGFLNILATHYENKKDFLKAIEYYYYAMEGTYTNEDRNVYAQVIERLRHSYTHKIDELESLIKKSPNHVNMIGALANQQMQIFMLDEAQTNYAKVLRLDPENKIAHYNLGLLLRKKGEQQLSVEYLQRAIDLGFTNAMVFNNLAIGYKNIDEAVKAEEIFLKAIEVDENYWYALFNLAKLYAVREKNDKAVEYFLKARRIVIEQGLSPDNIDTYLSVINKSQRPEKE